jgi:hypothetical protein
MTWKNKFDRGQESDREIIPQIVNKEDIRKDRRRSLRDADYR